MAYTKLFSSIVHSTIWREPDHTRLVWITMLALADRNGLVEASVPGLADISRVSVEHCREALTTLLAPDPDSRSPEFEGRRVEVVRGGWQILNHATYRDRQTADVVRQQTAQRVRRHREKCNAPCNANVTPETHTSPSPSPDTKQDQQRAVTQPEPEKQPPTPREPEQTSLLRKRSRKPKPDPEPTSPSQPPPEADTSETQAVVDALWRSEDLHAEQPGAKAFVGYAKRVLGRHRAADPKRLADCIAYALDRLNLARLTDGKSTGGYRYVETVIATVMPPGGLEAAQAPRGRQAAPPIDSELEYARREVARMQTRQRPRQTGEGGMGDLVLFPNVKAQQ